MAKIDTSDHWTLMHKNRHVADLKMVEEVGIIAEVLQNHNIAHLPIGTYHKDEKEQRIKLNGWLKKRAIPASRENISEALDILNLINTNSLALKSYALSLSDQYWLKPKELDIDWKDVNFFQNDFSEDMGVIIVGENRPHNPEELDFFSPDTSLDGILEKKWIIEDNKRVLVKGSNPLYRQEPYNEKIASDIMKELNINHVPYELTMIKNKPYSKCECFINENTEYVTVFRVAVNTAQMDGDTKMSHILRGCDMLGMDVNCIKTEFDKMIVIDYLIANYDRHPGNFGFIRNADTLEWLGMAPIFDTGASLWHYSDEINDDIKSRSFSNYQSEELSLITDLSWYQPIPEEKLRNIITTTLEKHPRMQPDRRVAIVNKVIERADTITNLKRELELNPRQLVHLFSNKQAMVKQ